MAGDCKPGQLFYVIKSIHFLKFPLFSVYTLTEFNCKLYRDNQVAHFFKYDISHHNKSV